MISGEIEVILIHENSMAKFGDDPIGKSGKFYLDIRPGVDRSCL